MDGKVRKKVTQTKPKLIRVTRTPSQTVNLRGILKKQKSRVGKTRRGRTVIRTTLLTKLLTIVVAATTSGGSGPRRTIAVPIIGDASGT